MWISLITLLLLWVGVVLWLQQMKSRERALTVAQKACEARQVQLVDETIHFKGFRLARGMNGKVVIERDYHFDYSLNGQTRYHGRVLLAGSKVKQVRMDDGSSQHHASLKSARIIPFRKREAQNDNP